jgi:hypothetical protein
MSYEPTLVIRKSDLEKNRRKIEEAEYVTVPETKFRGKWAARDRVYLEQSYEELQKALNIGTVKFQELEIVIICPEGSTHNRNVRDLLDELNIEYKLDN